MMGLNKIYAHPKQPQMQVQVILASQHPNGSPLFTVRMRLPRIIWAECLTHREWSRNARSSRAVPVKVMLGEVRNAPFIPWHWLKNQPGMQGAVPLEEGEIEEAIHLWLEARDDAVHAVERLFDPDGLNIHKQNPNRLLEPFSWIDTLVTTTSFSNFLWLREHKDAEPHLQDLAHMVAEAIQGAQPTPLKPGEWHLPYIGEEDWLDLSEDIEDESEMLDMARKISAARCARISYTPFDGGSALDHKRELERYNQLVTSERVHASPLEHIATPDEFFTGKELGQFPPEPGWAHPELHGNLEGWQQYRKMIPGEYHRG